MHDSYQPIKLHLVSEFLRYNNNKSSTLLVVGFKKSDITIIISMNRTRMDALTSITDTCFFFFFKWCKHLEIMTKSSNRSICIPLWSQFLICRNQKKDHCDTVLLTGTMHSIWSSRVFEKKWRQWIVWLPHATSSLSDQFTMEVC